MDTVLNSTQNANILKQDANRFLSIKLKTFYIWALNFPHMY